MEKIIYFHEGTGELVLFDLDLGEYESLDKYVMDLGKPGCEFPLEIRKNLSERSLTELMVTVEFRPKLAISRFYHLEEDKSSFILATDNGINIALYKYAFNSRNKLLKDAQKRIHLIQNVDL